MTEEGVKDLSDYHFEFKSDVPVRADLITAVTNSFYKEFTEVWKGTGFLFFKPFPFSLQICNFNCTYCTNRKGKQLILAPEEILEKNKGAFGANC